MVVIASPKYEVHAYMCVSMEKRKKLSNSSQLSKGASPHWKVRKPHGKWEQGHNGKETGTVHLIHRSLMGSRLSYTSEEEVLFVAIISKVEEEIP